MFLPTWGINATQEYVQIITYQFGLEQKAYGIILTPYFITIWVQGRVYYFQQVNLSWGVLCNHVLIFIELLTFSCADALPFTNAYFGEHSSPGTNLTNLRCYGSESRLIDCTYSNTTTCSASNVVGVRCQGKTVAGMKLEVFNEDIPALFYARYNCWMRVLLSAWFALFAWCLVCVSGMGRWHTG